MALWTLHRHIFREMGKVFLLTAIGLTGILSMTGGVFNMIRLEGISAVQLLQIMAVVLPVAVTITLPVAALFSATITYGRMSADNEFTACRGGGININALLLPAVAIGLVSTAFTFYFINYIIPNFIRESESYIRQDLQRIVTQQMRTRGHMAVGNYRFYSDDLRELPAEQGRSRTELIGCAFVELQKDAVARIGTAASAMIQFDRGEESPKVGAEMRSVRVLDLQRNRYYELDRQAVAPYELSEPLRLKPKWLNLAELLHYLRHPQSWEEVARRIDAIRLTILKVRFYRELADALRSGDHSYTISSDAMTCVIRAEEVRFESKDERPTLIQVQIEQRRLDHRRSVAAGSAELAIDRSTPDGEPLLLITAERNVEIRDSQDWSTVIRRDQEKLDPVPLKGLMEAGRDLADQEILNSSDDLNMPAAVTEARARVARDVGELTRKITGVIHSRLAFSAGIVALVILGAAMGIIFRGSQFLVAFGISFIPSVFVIATIIAGRQVSQSPHTTILGLALLWSGIAAIVVLDAIVLTKVLRR